MSERTVPTCSACPQLDERPINPGVHYCWGFMTWRSPDDRVDPCPYRDRQRYRAPYAEARP